MTRHVVVVNVVAVVVIFCFCCSFTRDLAACRTPFYRCKHFSCWMYTGRYGAAAVVPCLLKKNGKKGSAQPVLFIPKRTLARKGVRSSVGRDGCGEREMPPGKSWKGINLLKSIASNQMPGCAKSGATFCSERDACVLMLCRSVDLLGANIL